MVYKTKNLCEFLSFSMTKELGYYIILKHVTLIHVSYVILSLGESSNELYVRNKCDLTNITVFEHLHWTSAAKKLQIIRNYLWDTGSKNFVQDKLSSKHSVKKFDKLDELVTSFAGTDNVSIMKSCDPKNTVYLHVQ